MNGELEWEDGENPADSEAGDDVLGSSSLADRRLGRAQGNLSYQMDKT